MGKCGGELRRFFFQHNHRGYNWLAATKSVILGAHLLLQVIPVMVDHVFFSCQLFCNIAQNSKNFMVFFMVWIIVQCHLHLFQAESWNNDPMPSRFRHLVPCLTPLCFVFLLFLVFPPPGLATKKKANCHLCQCPCQCSQLQIA